MSYKLRNKLEVSISITQNSNIVDVPLDKYCALSELNITESTKYTVPLLYLELQDASQFFTSNPLSDGQLLTVSILTNGIALQQSKYRVYSFKTRFTGTAVTVQIDAYLDCPKYWFESSFNTYNNNTSSVISEIANKCNLKSDVVVTNDKQLWCQGNMTNSKFCHYLAKHGYKTSSSYMVLALNAKGTLIYRDVNNLKNDGYFSVTQYTQVENSYTATDVQVSSISGLNNCIGGGYGISLLDQEKNKIHDSLTVSKSIDYNTEVAKSIKQSIVRFSNIRPDVSSNFWLGTYQNSRFSKLFSAEASLIINSYTQITLLNRINLTALLYDGTPDKINSGEYIVDTRTIIIRGVNYAERITACRLGRS